MTQRTIQSWTDSQVMLKLGEHRAVKYRVYEDADSVYQEIRADDDKPIHTLELPDGLRLDQKSYEVLLRYVLLHVSAA